MKPDKPINILTADLVIPDLIVRVQDSEKLQKLVRHYKLEGVSKQALTDEQFAEFSAVVKEMKAAGKLTVEPGGSSANVLVTLSKLLGKGKLNTKYLGIAGDDEYTEKAKTSFNEAGVELFPDPKTYQNNAPNPQSARSFVLLYEDGRRTIVTHPGNAKSILKPYHITDDMVKDSDVVFVQGSLWQKFDEKFPDKLVTQRWDNKHDKKELWLALPTHAKFGEENAKKFQWLIPSANLILGNMEELARIYQVSHNNPEALKKLQQTFNNEQHVLRDNGYTKGQVAFITLEDQGAAIVTKDKIEFVNTRDIKPEEIINTLGAGDTAFAGFAAGYLKGLPHQTSAEIAMALANQKLRHNGPRLNDPQEALKQSSPYLASLVLSDAKDRELVGSAR
ncbi:MAG: carbohydrate kinase family protein [Pseudomonadota bacterium]